MNTEKHGLTEYAEFQNILNEELLKYTNLRNYFFKILQGEYDTPLIKIQNTTDNTNLEIDLSSLPADVAEYIISSFLEHSEKMVFDVWHKLAENAASAVNKIKLVKTKSKQPVVDTELLSLFKEEEENA